MPRIYIGMDDTDEAGFLGGFLGWLTLNPLRKAGFVGYLAEKR